MRVECGVSAAFVGGIFLLGSGMGFAQDTIFQDGFESGDVSAWSSVVASNIFVLPFGGPEQTRIWRFDPIVKQTDIFFNVDTTGSMGGVIANLKSGLSTIIASTLTQVEDPAFGVGAFDDFPVSPFGDSASGDVPFRLLQGVTTDMPAVQTAVDALDLHGGADFPESGFEALFQVAVGSGISGGTAYYLPPLTTAGRIGGAQFRIGSLPLALHITDALAHDASTPCSPDGGPCQWNSDYPSSYNDHSKIEALGALQAIDARVITIQPLHDSPWSGYNQVVTDQTQEISVMTEAVVPVCVFKTDAVNWRCGANTCCDGTIMVGNNCILRYTITSNGAGFSEAVIDG
ncbi:MAG: hypothetical protein K8R59_04140, partial [Thermoanaerobaculales bacterium]|nr:hypothetical protein [Thermoanaerobaculales bacterium]